MSAYLKSPGSPAGPLTADEFLELPDDPTGTRWQLADGEAVMMAPPSATHCKMQANLATLLNNHLWQAKPDCSVFTAVGIAPRARRDSNVRIPDLAVQCGPTRRGEALLDDPMLIIAILSVSNRAQTWANVWTYATIPNLQEILVIRTASVAAEILRRNADGSWPKDFQPITETVDLRSIGAAFPLAAAYRGIDFGDV